MENGYASSFLSYLLLLYTMASNDNNHSSNRSDPISIPFSAQRGRNRSMSVSSASSGSGSSASEIATPVSPNSASQRITIPSPSTSPILSFFLAQSPTAAKTPSTAGFPFKHKFGTAPVFEEEVMEAETPIAAHARRASATMSSRFGQNAATTPFGEGQTGRGTNVLRRLSLSSTTFKPQLDMNGRVQPPSPPPNTAVSPTSNTGGAPFSNKPRRSATISVDNPKARRAPSPMGERILKGHFDGFN
ncbi:hypothetical protein D9619_004155 [Psilocybe cf. subviscida]|uniref:Uncharacterized protein n=1 Tax=Psilocybe cf. subviscida TaxID=2480587 RepID=A0A8H5F8R4_9AGAR|nr:hypothetical protein D9619_004155 [Psilocybe cf. subviscida]